MYQQFRMSNYKSSVSYRLNYITFGDTYVYLDDVQALLNLCNEKKEREKGRKNNTVFEKCAEFFPVGREAQ